MAMQGARVNLIEISSRVKGTGYSFRALLGTGRPMRYDYHLHDAEGLLRNVEGPFSNREIAPPSICKGWPLASNVYSKMADCSLLPVYSTNLLNFLHA